MVTVAVEAPTANAAIQFGRQSLGLGVSGGKGFGLRSGGIGLYDQAELNLLIFGGKMFAPRDRDLARDKGYEFAYFWSIAVHDKEVVAVDMKEGKWFNLCQIEAALGCLVGVRVGVNLAEILDFVLGWTTLDICGDDIATIEKKEQLEFRKRKATEF